MATDNWIGFEDNWDTPDDWSHGVPRANSDVVIAGGYPQVTKSFGTVASITNDAVLTFTDAGKSSVTHRLINSGTIDLDANGDEGGSNLSIGGALDNSGYLLIGNSSISAGSTVKAASVTNFIGTTHGHITLEGSSTTEATLDVASAAGFGAAGTLYGGVELVGDALVEFARGQINTIATGAGLTLLGPDAFIADASNASSNSALTGLKTVAGDLTLENGATVTTSEALTNSGDVMLGNDAAMSVPGTFTNSGIVDLDQSTEVGRVSLTVGGALTNEKSIDVGASEGQAALSVKGPSTNDGGVEFGNGIGKFAGAVSGTGTFDISNGSTLQFDRGVSSGQQVDFQPYAANTLTLESASTFHGTIEDFFTGGDTVDARTFAKKSTKFMYTQTSTDSCTWTLTDGARTAALTFTGEPYVKSDFSIVSANHGAGSAIEFV